MNKQQIWASIKKSVRWWVIYLVAASCLYVVYLQYVQTETHEKTRVIQEAQYECCKDVREIEAIIIRNQDVIQAIGRQALENHKLILENQELIKAHAKPKEAK